MIVYTQPGVKGRSSFSFLPPPPSFLGGCTVAGDWSGREKGEDEEEDAPFERNSLSWLHAVRISLQRHIAHYPDNSIRDDHLG